MQAWFSNRHPFRSFHQAVWFKPGLAALSIGLALYAVATFQPPATMRTASAPLLT